MDDWIFDIAITANRPDCQSIYGIAREVAAVLGKECREPALDYTETAVQKDFKVEVSAKDLCPRYIAHYVHDVTIGESPGVDAQKTGVSRNQLDFQHGRHHKLRVKRARTADACI